MKLDHGLFVFRIDRWFVIEGKAHGHKSSDRGYPLASASRPRYSLRGAKKTGTAMNLRMIVIGVNMEGGEMTDWIDDLALKAKEKNAEELAKGKIRLRNAEIIGAQFPDFWEALVKQVDNDCFELKKRLPDDRSYHLLRRESAPNGFSLTCEAAQPIRQLSVHPNIEGQRIDIFGHTTTVISVTVVGNNLLSFVWEGKTYASERDLSKALIDYCVSGK